MFILLNGFEISHRRLPFFSPKRMRKERYVLRSRALFRSRKTFQYDRRHHYHRSNVHTPPPMPTAPVQVSIIFANDKKLSFFAKQRLSMKFRFILIQVPHHHNRISKSEAPQASSSGYDHDENSFITAKVVMAPQLKDAEMTLGMFEHWAAKVSQHILHDRPWDGVSMHYLAKTPSRLSREQDVMDENVTLFLKLTLCKNFFQL